MFGGVAGRMIYFFRVRGKRRDAFDRLFCCSSKICVYRRPLCSSTPSHWPPSLYHSPYPSYDSYESHIPSFSYTTSVQTSYQLSSAYASALPSSSNR